MRWTDHGEAEGVKGSAFRLGPHKAGAFRKESLKCQHVLWLPFSLKSATIPAVFHSYVFILSSSNCTGHENLKTGRVSW